MEEINWIPIIVPVITVIINMLVGWVAWSIRTSAKQEMANVSANMTEQLASVSSSIRTELAEVSSEIKKSLDEHDKRLQELELRHQYAPGHEDLQRLHDRVSNVKDAVTAMASEVQGAHADIGGLKRLMEILVRHHIPEAGALQRGENR
ncbi:MAG: hypothetical protein TEF_00325 [Rhizobiales bacterium NRL2]|jgi:mevalonate kinase|nr:MAG: hypothetical protein TEF_00325 [Rhizobiales bacterium NRL2]